MVLGMEPYVIDEILRKEKERREAEKRREANRPRPEIPRPETPREVPKKSSTYVQIL